MIGLTLDDHKMILRTLDTQTLEERAKRFQELWAVTIGAKNEMSSRAYSYQQEVASSYTNGNFRACIFASTCIIEQIFRHEYVKAAVNRDRSIEEIKDLNLGRLIQKIKELNNSGKFEYLEPLITDAEMLNRIRNKMATHPMYVDLPPASKDEMKRRDELIAEDILNQVRLLVETNSEIKPEDREGETEQFLTRSTVGIHTLKEVLENKFWIGSFRIESTSLRELIEGDMLRPLALRSYNLMKRITEGIYGA